MPPKSLKRGHTVPSISIGSRTTAVSAARIDEIDRALNSVSLKSRSTEGWVARSSALIDVE